MQSIFEARRILSNKLAITSHHAFIMLPHSHCSLLHGTFDLISFRRFVTLRVSRSSSFVRLTDRRHCVLYASKQCDCDAVSRTLFLGASIINADCADETMQDVIAFTFVQFVALLLFPAHNCAQFHGW